MCGVGHVTGVIDTSRYRHSFKGTERGRERAAGSHRVDGRRGGPTHYSTVYRYIPSVCVLASRPFFPLFFPVIHTPPSPTTHSCAMKVVPFASDRVMHEETAQLIVYPPPPPPQLTQNGVVTEIAALRADTKCKLCVMYQRVGKEVEADRLTRVRESKRPGLVHLT